METVIVEDIHEVHWLPHAAWLSKNPGQIDAWNAVEKQDINGVECGKFDASIH